MKSEAQEKNVRRILGAQIIDKSLVPLIFYDTTKSIKDKLDNRKKTE